MAVGSTESRIGFPRQALIRDGDVLEKLSRLIEQEHIRTVLLGSPVKRDGSPGDIHIALKLFASQLQHFSIPIILVDERYSTKIAQAKLREVNIAARDQKSLLDSLAAQVVLQEWLDQ